MTARAEDVLPDGSVVAGGKDFQRRIWAALRDQLTPERFWVVWKWNRDLCMSAPDGGHGAEAVQRWKNRIIGELRGASRPRARLARRRRVQQGGTR